MEQGDKFRMQRLGGGAWVALSESAENLPLMRSDSPRGSTISAATLGAKTDADGGTEEANPLFQAVEMGGLPRQPSDAGAGAGTGAGAGVNKAGAAARGGGDGAQAGDGKNEGAESGENGVRARRLSEQRERWDDFRRELAGSESKVAGYRELFEAARAGDLEFVRYLVEQCSLDPSAGLQGTNATPLHAAASAGHREVAEYLLADKRVRADVLTHRGKSPLMAACEGGRVELVRRLLDSTRASGADLATRTLDGETAMTFAAMGGHVDIIRLLRERGAPVDLADGNRMSPLAYAAQRDRLEAVRVLLEEMGASADPRGAEEQRPLWVAARRGNKEVVALLLKHGADAGFADEEGETLFFKLVRERNTEMARFLCGLIKLDVERRCKGGVTALMVAAKNMDEAMCFFLLRECRASLEAEDDSGTSAMWLLLNSRLHNVVLYVFARQKKLMQRKQLLGFVLDSRNLFSLATLASDAYWGACLKGINDNPSRVYAALRCESFFRVLGESEPSYRAVAADYASRLNLIALHSLEHARVDNELFTSIVLERRDHFAGHTRESESVIDLALTADNVRFVSHPKVAGIVDLWWRGSAFRASLASGLPVLFNPLAASRQPRMRFLMDCLGLLVLIIAFTMFALQSVALGDEMGGVEIFIYVNCVALIAQELPQWLESRHEYWSEGWNIVDVAVCGCVVLIAAARFVARGPGWGNATAEIEVAYMVLVVACSVLLWLRALFVFTFVEVIGPLLITLHKMVRDILAFAALQAVFLLGFFASFSFLLSAEDAGIEGLDGPRPTLMTMVRVGLGGGDALTGFDALRRDRRVIAEVLAVLYLLLSSVVLINLLIAMMGHTFQRVKSQTDAEFVFSRAKLQRRYDQSPTGLPIPLNLIALVVYTVAYPFAKCFACLAPVAFCAHCHERLDRSANQWARDLAERPAWKALKPHRWLPPLWTSQNFICVCGRTRRAVEGPAYMYAQIVGVIFACTLWLPLMLPAALLWLIYEYALCWRCCRAPQREGSITSRIMGKQMNEANAPAEHEQRSFWRDVFPQPAPDMRDADLDSRLDAVSRRLGSAAAKIDAMYARMEDKQQQQQQGSAAVAAAAPQPLPSPTQSQAQVPAPPAARRSGSRPSKAPGTPESSKRRL